MLIGLVLTGLGSVAVFRAVDGNDNSGTGTPSLSVHPPTVEPDGSVRIRGDGCVTSRPLYKARISIQARSPGRGPYDPRAVQEHNRRGDETYGGATPKVDGTWDKRLTMSTSSIGGTYLLLVRCMVQMPDTRSVRAESFSYTPITLTVAG